MKDTEKIRLTLRVFKCGQFTEDEAVDYIIKFYAASKSFQGNSFFWGWTFGGVVSLITYYLTVKP